MNHFYPIFSYPTRSIFPPPLGVLKLNKPLFFAIAIIFALSTLYSTFCYLKNRFFSDSKSNSPSLVRQLHRLEKSLVTLSKIDDTPTKQYEQLKTTIPPLDTLEFAREALQIEALHDCKQSAKYYAELANALMATCKRLDNFSIGLKIHNQFIAIEELYLLALILHPFEAAIERGIWSSDGKTVGKRTLQLLVSIKARVLKAISLNPAEGRFFCVLSLLLSSEKEEVLCSIEEKKVYMNKKQLLKRAILLRPNYPHAYTLLADLLSPGESEEISNLNKAWSAQDLYLRALECDSNEKTAFLGLLDTLSKLDPQYLNEEGLPSKELYQKIIELNPPVSLARQALETLI